jgi:deazaflavin-dependent oxidoreductase (nitroreductase family)
MADQEFSSALDNAREVELTVRGRRSGREITRTVWFVHDDRRVDLVPIHGTDSDWFKNVVATPDVRLAAGGRELEAAAVPVTDAEPLGAIIDAFKAKYGADTFDELYPKQDAAVELPLG